MWVDYDDDIDEICVEVVLSETDWEDLCSYQCIVREVVARCSKSDKKQISLIVRRNDATSKRL